MQDPEPYLESQGIELTGAVDKTAPAMVGISHRRFVNWELFYFANDANAAAFDRDPLRYCGEVTDPVSRMRFRPSSNSPSERYKDRLFFFESNETRDTFLTMPDSLFLPVALMEEPAN